MGDKMNKKTILVIEDDPAVLAMLVKNLSRVGYEIIEATDGLEGLKMVGAGHYDLVITDIVMPFVSGVGVVSALKQKRPGVPVIAITGYGKEPETAAMEKNADLVLAKPVKISFLERADREADRPSRKGGCAVTKLFILSGSHKGQSFDLKGEAVHVGRSPENHIQIHDKSISRKHMKIVSKEGKWFIVDLKSTNGTFVANKPIQPGTEVELAEGIPVTIGNVGICLGKPEQWDCLAVEDSIDLSDGFKETGVFDRPMTSPKNLDLIFKISNVLMESLKINEILEKVLNYIFELLARIDRGVIILVEGETGKILDVISRTSDRGDKTTQMYSRSIVDRVIKERRALIMSDTQGEQGSNPSASMELMKVRSVMCVPLISRSQIRGVLYVDSVDKPFGFRKEDLALLSALSAPAAIAIENALLYSRLESLVEERTRSLRETQDKLKESEARFKGIFDHMSSGVVVYRTMNQGEDFHVLDLNRADQSLEKVKDRKGILGKGMYEAFPELKKTHLLQVMRRVWKTGMPERCSLSLSEGERYQWWREYYVYRLPSGEIVAIFDDVTQVRKAEEEQKTLQRQLLFSQKMESVGAFASGTAHNFRNILQAISGNMEYIEVTHQNDPEVKEVARAIYDSVEKGVDLINNLLHFSRSGRTSMSFHTSTWRM